MGPVTHWMPKIIKAPMLQAIYKYGRFLYDSQNFAYNNELIIPKLWTALKI